MGKGSGARAAAVEGATTKRKRATEDSDVPAVKERKEKKLKTERKRSAADESPKKEAKRSASDGSAKKEKPAKRAESVPAEEPADATVQPEKDAEATTLSGGVTEVPAVAAADELKKVEDAGLSSGTVRALKSKNIETLFPIQSATLETIRDGKDLIARAKTGSGKTLAFVLPIVEKMAAAAGGRRKSRTGAIQAVVLAPTRELANQVGRDFEFVAEPHGLKTLCIYGGAPFGPQCNAIRSGIDIIVATPGRLIDHIERETISLAEVQFVVLDEADEMLSMGFKDEVEKVLKRAAKPHQTLLFSATVPKWVTELGSKYLIEGYRTVDMVGESKDRTNKDITHLAISCPWHARGDTLGDLVKVHAGSSGKSLVFTDTKKEANELAEDAKLVALGSAVLHGDIPQAQREATLERYRNGRVKCLIATDVAARGLDIAGVDLVVQTHPPMNYETYIHRSGRTGRAGKKGVCVTFYTVKEQCAVRVLEHKAGVKLRRVGPPQPADVVRAGVLDAAKVLEDLNKDSVKRFRDAADELVKKSGKEATELLAGALAHMSGQTAELKPRSILSCMEDNVAIIVAQHKEFEGPKTGWQLVRRFFPDLAPRARGMTVCAGRKTAIFDVPTGDADAIENVENLPEWVSFSIATELPELEEGMNLQDAESQLREKKSMMFAKRGGGFSAGRFGGRGGGGGGGGRGGGGSSRYGGSRDGAGAHTRF